MSNVWRTDVRKDAIRFQVDAQVMFFVVQGLRHEASEIRAEIVEHEQVCGEEPSYCRVRYESLIVEYGSIEEAVKQAGVVLYDCMENLADLHSTLGKLMATIHKANLVMMNPEAMGEDPDMTDWRPADKLKGIKAEVAHREEAGKTETGLMPKIEEEGSILGLTENLPVIDKKIKDKPAGEKVS